MIKCTLYARMVPILINLVRLVCLYKQFGFDIVIKSVFDQLFKHHILVPSIFRNDWSWSPRRNPESRQLVLALYFLPNQQALILPVHLINMLCQIWFAMGLVLTKRREAGARCPQTPQEPQPWTPPCCYVQLCLVSYYQSALIKTVSCTQVTPLSTAVCVCMWLKHDKHTLEDNVVIHVHEPTQTWPF